MLVQRSFQPPPLSAVRIAGGDVVLALARHLEADRLQGGNHVGAAAHRAVLDALHQVVADQLAWVSFVLEASPQLRRLDVGAMARLLRPGPRRVVRAAPPVLVVEGVAQGVEGLLPAGRRDVQAAARLQVALRGEDVRVDAAAALAVQDRRPRVAVRLEPRPGRLFEGIHDRADLRVGRSVVRCPGNHARGVLVLESQGVGHRSHLMGIPPEDLYALARLVGRVPRPEEVTGRVLGRAGTTGQELNVHQSRGGRRGPALRAPARWRPGGRPSRRSRRLL